MESSDAMFAGSVPVHYEKFIVPMLFEPYAADIVARVAALNPSSVLEVAAGTGSVTRQLARALPTTTRLVITDLNEGMLARARAAQMARPVEWLIADALALPFDDESFDVVVCQFGVMFFPDRPRGFAEARRVLTPGGTFVFNCWDIVAHNEFAETATEVIATFMPHDPPRLIQRTPHCYSDTDQIHADLAAAGFVDGVTIVTETRRSLAPDATTAARAYVGGTPLSGEIEARKPGTFAEATAVATAEFAARFGDGPIEGSMQAHVVTATKL